MPVLSTVGGASLRAFGAFLHGSGAASFISATGGTITTSGDYKYHTFTSSSTFAVSASPANKYIDILLVAAGGTSGGNNSTGGGGGVVIKQAELISIGSYSINVGLPVDVAGSNGQNTVALGFTALGGGGGGISGFSGTAVAGKSGGSGGGAGVIFGGPDAPPSSTAAGSGLQPTSSSGGFGNGGGLGVLVAIPGGFFMQGAAGGGAGGAASGNTPGPGKSGLPLSSDLYGGGGFGGSTPVANTGWGGANTTDNLAAAGIVIIRYLFQ
jgi:hypothetical protein